MRSTLLSGIFFNIFKQSPVNISFILIYYYKNAYKTLNCKKKTEWNGNITHSKENFVNDNNQKKVKIIVVKGDVIDYIEKPVTVKHCEVVKQLKSINEFF